MLIGGLGINGLFMTTLFLMATGKVGSARDALQFESAITLIWKL